MLEDSLFLCKRIRITFPFQLCVSTCTIVLSMYPVLCKVAMGTILWGQAIRPSWRWLRLRYEARTEGRPEHWLIQRHIGHPPLCIGTLSSRQLSFFFLAHNIPVCSGRVWEFQALFINENFLAIVSKIKVLNFVPSLSCVWIRTEEPGLSLFFTINSCALKKFP